jgi:chromosome segregation ATPase
MRDLDKMASKAASGDERASSLMGPPTSPSPTLSELKSSYICARLEKSRKRKHDLDQRSTAAKQALETCRERIEALRSSKEAEKLRQIDQQAAFETAREAYRHARERLQTEKDALTQTQGTINKISKDINKDESLAAGLQANQEDIKKQIHDLELIQEQTTRQVEILDLKAFEIESLVKRAQSKQTFLEKLQRVAEGTATEAMFSHIRSEVYDTLTGASKDELTGLAETILLTMDRKEARDSNGTEAVIGENGDNTARQKRSAGLMDIESAGLTAPGSATDSDGEYYQPRRRRRAPRVSTWL